MLPTDLVGPTFTVGFIGAPGDIAIIAVVVLVLFGASKLGTVGKSLGEGIREFKKATRDDDEAPKAEPAPPAVAKDGEK